MMLFILYSLFEREREENTCSFPLPEPHCTHPPTFNSPDPSFEFPQAGASLLSILGRIGLALGATLRREEYRSCYPGIISALAAFRVACFRIEF